MPTTFPLTDVVVLAFVGLVVVQIVSKVLRALIWLAAWAVVVGGVWFFMSHDSAVVSSALRSDAQRALAEIVRLLEQAGAWANSSLTRLSEHLPASLVGRGTPGPRR